MLITNHSSLFTKVIPLRTSAGLFLFLSFSIFFFFFLAWVNFTIMLESYKVCVPTCFII